MFSFRGHSSSSGSRFGAIARIFLRFLQIVFAITVAGLYGTDIDSERKVDEYDKSKWIYAVVVAAIAAITALVYMIPLIKSYMFFAWDFVIFILWVAVFGVFGKLYVDEEPDRLGIQRMRNAVWIDLINMLLWFISTVYGLTMFIQNRRHRTLHTGRATV